MTINKNQTFMSEQQAITLLEKEFSQGLYNLPDIAILNERESRLQTAGIAVPAAISSKDLTLLMSESIKRNKHKSSCARIPIKVIEKKLTMVCYLQNLNKNKQG